LAALPKHRHLDRLVHRGARLRIRRSDGGRHRGFGSVKIDTSLNPRRYANSIATRRLEAPPLDRAPSMLRKRRRSFDDPNLRNTAILPHDQLEHYRRVALGAVGIRHLGVMLHDRWAHTRRILSPSQAAPASPRTRK